MKNKNSAYKLHLKGLSYKQISDELGISKTAAFEYVKEVKLTNGFVPNEPIQNRSVLKKNKINLSQEEPNKANKVKEFTGDELLQKQFDSLNFEGKFLDLIGKPSKLFFAIIWGLPKGGKSNFAIRFADYLNEYFGSVLYVAAEEGESVTLQEKIKDIGGSKITFIESRDREQIRSYLNSRNFDFVFIDSINNANIDNNFLELIKSENPSKSFIGIVQATKSGNFKGDQGLTHNCDFIIKVVGGIAFHEGRFGPASESKIFEGNWYVKNPTPSIEKKKGIENFNPKNHKKNIDKKEEHELKLDFTESLPIKKIELPKLTPSIPQKNANFSEIALPKISLPIEKPKPIIPPIQINGNSFVKLITIGAIVYLLNINEKS